MYTHNLAIFCKTCYRDIESLKLLLTSIDKHNVDSIPVCLSISKSEKDLLLPIINLFKGNIEIFFDEDYFQDKVENNDKFLQDWLWQQHVKMNFYKSNFAKHYLLIDSDCYFIRSFKVSHFLYENKIPYIPLTMHTKAKRFPLQLIYKNDSTFFKSGVISQTLGYSGNEISIDMPFVLSSEYMYLFESYLKKNALSYYDILNKSPFEMQWYLEFCIVNNLPYKYTSAFFLPLHIDTQYQVYRLLGFDEDIIKKNYLGILMNKGHVKSTKFKPLFIGKYIIRPLLKLHYKLTQNRYDYKKDTGLIQEIFSLKNEYRANGKKYKIITILGIKIKLRIDKTNISKTPVAVEREIALTGRTTYKFKKVA